MIGRDDRGSIAILRIEHGKANALDLELLEGVSRELTKLEDEPATALVVTGAGRVFSAEKRCQAAAADRAPLLDDLLRLGPR